MKVETDIGSIWARPIEPAVKLVTVFVELFKTEVIGCFFGDFTLKETFQYQSQYVDTDNIFPCEQRKNCQMIDNKMSILVFGYYLKLCVDVD